eukprot:scaffold103369_cov20-Tisochrysis_lutea.AAC.1
MLKACVTLPCVRAACQQGECEPYAVFKMVHRATLLSVCFVPEQSSRSCAACLASEAIPGSLKSMRKAIGCGSRHGIGSPKPDICGEGHAFEPAE